MKLSKDAIELGPWSSSKVIEALSCPFRFNCSKEHKQIVTFPDDSAARVGTAIHEYIEILLTEPEKTANAETYYGIFSDNELTSDEQFQFKLLKTAAEDSVKRILKFKESNKCQDSDFHVELDLAFDEEFHPVHYFSKKVFFRGKIDLAMYLPNSIMVVVDHKSGMSKEIKEKFKFQLTSYLMLFYYSYLKKKNPSLEFPSSLYFLNSLGGNVPDILKGEKINSEDFIEEIENYFIETLNKAADLSKTNQAIMGSHCKYCHYLAICPAGVKL